MDRIMLWLVNGFCTLFWWWMHISPRYVGFRWDDESEPSFQDTKTGKIYHRERYALQGEGKSND